MRKWGMVIVVFLLMTGLIASSILETVGAGLEMDTDLGSSNASFIGEKGRVYSGFSVAGAGDVNGDGYDDFLIGAYQDSEAHIQAGQTYLIFGRASGWLMDVNLSNVNASFLGEEREDHSGHSVAGAGDVNGDGYDDILIGAYRNGAGGDWAGQAYLIFGKATGWAMDTDLSTANASFWGEHADDRAGYSVASAGDVNSDGYDDILIGAPSYRGGKGKTYLIYGKATGWSMDNDLSDSDASFIGGNGQSGHAVAGAGDFNGDGYDDILIGEHFYNPGGGNSGTGLTYLVFGNSSKLSKDADLTKMNASYLGERMYDYSGASVAGAGDVNGDGFDDILIGARGFDYKSASSAGKTYIILGNSSGWSKKMTLSKANVSYLGESDLDQSGHSVSSAGDVNDDGYSDIITGAPGNDDGGLASGQAYIIQGRSSGWSGNYSLSEAGASYWGEDREDFAGRSVAGVGDVNVDGFDDVLIGAYCDEDGGGDFAGQTYLILGNYTPPRFEADMTPKTATTGDPFAFNVTVGDDNGVINVSVEYWYGDTFPHNDVPLNQSSGDQLTGTWIFNMTIPADSTDTLHYIFHTRDNATTLRSIKKDVEIIDDDPPVIVQDLTPPNATTYDDFTFILKATDNIEVSKVMLEYWYGDNGTHTNTSMTKGAGNLWDLTIFTPLDSLDMLHYLMYCEDPALNNDTTPLRNVTIIDDDEPMFSADYTPGTGTTGETLTFIIGVEDNIGVFKVEVSYWFGESMTIHNESMIRESDIGWQFNITIPTNTTHPLNYLFTAWDAASNSAITEVRNVTIEDNDLPILVSDLTSSSGGTGDPFLFEVEITDNIDVSKVWVVYWFGVSTHRTNISLIKWSTDVWITTISLPESSVDQLHYRIGAQDVSYNYILSSTRHVEVIDNEAPVFTEDKTTRFGTTGEAITFSVTARDNIGITNITLIYWYGDGDRTQVDFNVGAGPPWPHEVTVPSDSIEWLNYQYHVWDGAGNDNITAIGTIKISDNDPPILGPDLTDVDPIKGLSLSFEIGVMDNIAISDIHLEYWFDGEPHENVTVPIDGDHRLNIEIPRHPGGDLHYFFSAVDLEGNWNMTAEVTLSPINVRPSARNVPDWSIREGELGQLNLGLYLVDENDAVAMLSIQCDEANIFVDGLVLETLYELPVDRTGIDIRISDGEDTTSIVVFLSVTPVNDHPIILDIEPLNGSEFKKGQEIVFTVNASDEEDDVLTITWIVDGTILGTGSPFGYSKLSKGEHTITVSVNDGADVTKATFIVKVKVDKDEESPGVDLIWIVLAIALAAVVTVTRRN